MLALALLIISLVLLVLAACTVPTPPRLSLGWLGLAFLAASMLATSLKLG